MVGTRHIYLSFGVRFFYDFVKTIFGLSLDRDVKLKPNQSKTAGAHLRYRSIAMEINYNICYKSNRARQFSGPGEL